MQDLVTEKSELILDALQYAHDHNLDINNRDDVRKILEVIDPEHEEDVDEFLELLKNADTVLEIINKESESKNRKTNLPN